MFKFVDKISLTNTKSECIICSYFKLILISKDLIQKLNSILKIYSNIFILVEFVEINLKKERNYMSDELIVELIKTINSFRDEFNQKLDVMQQEIVEMKQEIVEIKKDVSQLKKDVAEIKKDVAEIKQDIEKNCSKCQNKIA